MSDHGILKTLKPGDVLHITQLDPIKTAMYFSWRYCEKVAMRTETQFFSYHVLQASNP